MTTLSPATQYLVEAMKAVQPETAHCYIEQLVMNVYRDSYAEGAAQCAVIGCRYGPRTD